MTMRKVTLQEVHERRHPSKQHDPAVFVAAINLASA
jgi:hypothetical protein